MPALSDVYMEWDWRWSEGVEPKAFDEMADNTICLKVVNLYCMLFLSLSGECPSWFAGEYDATITMLPSDKYTAVTLICQGLLPCAPFHPSVITIPTMEVYHMAHLQCPQFTIQPFVKMLCDLHTVTFWPYLLQQFSICYDLYINILNTVQGQVLKALGCNVPDWRALNTCPSCIYKLEGEPKLWFQMLGNMDGNDSMKRVEKRGSKVINDDGGVLPRISIERPDLWCGREGLLLIESWGGWMV